MKRIMPQTRKKPKIHEDITSDAAKEQYGPELRVIYSSFSDRLGIRANLRLQRSLDSALYQRIFPCTRLNNKHVVTLAERALPFAGLGVWSDASNWRRCRG